MKDIEIQLLYTSLKKLLKIYEKSNKKINSKTAEPKYIIILTLDELHNKWRYQQSIRQETFSLVNLHFFRLP